MVYRVDRKIHLWRPWPLFYSFPPWWSGFDPRSGLGFPCQFSFHQRLHIR
jgi:hypothetical protein